MSSLIDIGTEAIAIQDALFESYGELSPALEEQLDALLAKGSSAMDAAAWVVRKLEGDAQTCKDEAKRLRDRADGIEREIAALKGRMLFAVDAAFGGKLKTATTTIWGQDSGAVMEIELSADADIIMLNNECSEFVRKTYALDKTAIRHRYEAGDPIPNSITVTERPGKRSLRLR